MSVDGGTAPAREGLVLLLISIVSTAAIATPTGTLSSINPNTCTGLMSATTLCTAFVTWSTSNIGSNQVGVWVNGSLLTCQANGTNFASPNLHLGTTYVYKLMIGPSACTIPLSGTQFGSQQFTPGAAPIGPCGNTPWTICGHLVDDAGHLVGEITTVELRSATGAVLASSSTASGQYAFVNSPGLPLTPNTLYYVAPAVGRSQASSPSQTAITPSFEADFTIHGVTAQVDFENEPSGTFILLTQGPFFNGGEPVASPDGPPFFATVSGGDGTAHLSVPGGVSYGVMCWVLTPFVGFTRSTGTYVNGGASLNAGDHIQHQRC